MSSDDAKHVQTELSAEEYERFRRFAREQGLSLKEASHEAVVEWVERRQQADPSDPAFTALDDLERAGGESDARTEDDLVDEWRGTDASFTLADDPSDRT